MPRRPNYRFERAERDRAKQAKKDQKLKRQHERVSARSTDGPSLPDTEPGPDVTGSARKSMAVTANPPAAQDSWFGERPDPPQRATARRYRVVSLVTHADIPDIVSHKQRTSF